MKFLAVLFLIFVNYFNPISIYFTLSVNLFFCGFAFVTLKEIKVNYFILFFTSFVFLLATMIMLCRGNFNSYVFGKYFRVFVSTIMIMIISKNYNIKLNEFIKILTVIFLSHVIAVGIQLIFPILDIPMAYLFGFDREVDVISDMSYRKLGLSSSYDSAGMISVVSMIFFCIQYKYKKKNIYLILATASLISTLVISRTGMLIGVVIFLLSLIYFSLSMKGVSKFFPLSILAFCIYVGFVFILPILIASNISFLSDLYLSGDNDVSSDFTSGSFDALTSTHLDALQISFFDLIFGFGKDPNKVLGMATDIGYIKLIYHVGLIGLVSIFIIVLYIFYNVIKFKVSENENLDFVILKNFIIFYILIILLFNYKSLELYSRGSHDMLLILFLFFYNLKFNNSLLFNVNSNKQIKI